MPSNILHEIHRAYLEMAPIDAEMIPILRTLPGYPSIDAQEVFCRQIVNSAYAHFPPSKRWMKNLLKRIQNDVADGELSDDLTELFLTFMTFSQDYADDAEFCDEAYLTFTPAQDTNEGGGEKSTLTTTLRVLRLHNDVGTRIWEAGLYLAEVLYGCPSILARKTCVELGAGSGVTSLLTIRNCCSKEREKYLPSTAIITDNMPEVIKNLKYNVELNATAEWTEELPVSSSSTDRSYIYSAMNVANSGTGSAGSETVSKCIVTTQHLDFETATTEKCRRLRPDVILVADCTYAEDMHLPLIAVVEKLLCISTRTSESSSLHQTSTRPDFCCNTSSSTTTTTTTTSSSSSSSKRCEYFCPIEKHLADVTDSGRPMCLLAGTIRNPSTYTHFTDALTANTNLQWDDVSGWAKTVAGEQRYRYDNRNSIRILLIMEKVV